MGCGDDDGDAGFADQQTAQAMNHGNAANFILCSYFHRNLKHHLEGHRLVTVVIQIARGTSFGIITGRALEGDDRTLGTSKQARYDGACVDGVPGEGDEMPVPEDFRILAGATANGGKERHLVTFSNTFRNICKLLITSYYNARGKFQ